MRATFGQECNQAIAELVLDGVLEIEREGRYVSGSEAYDLIYGGRPVPKAQGKLAQLAQAALQYHVLTTSARKTPLRSARFEVEIVLLPFCPRRFGPLTRFVFAREAFSGTNEFAVNRSCTA